MCLKLILNSKRGTEEMVVAYFWAFNWETEDTNNRKYLGLALITAYTSTFRSLTQTTNVASGRGPRKEQDVHADAWGQHILEYVLR
jgi:hypothetical protein